MTRAIANANIKAELTANLSNTVEGATQAGTKPSIQAGRGYKYSASDIASGTLANQADRIWHSISRALTSGSSETIDVYDLGSLDIGAGAGRDGLGQLWTVAEIVGILIRSATTSAGNLIIGGEGSGAAWNSLWNGSDTAQLLLPPGGLFLMASPADPAWAVTDVTNHLLKLAASGGAVTYDITLLGRSA